MSAARIVKTALACGALFAVIVLAGRAAAFTAVALGDFEGIEEPSVRYYTDTGKFVPDRFVNITASAPGVFRMELRRRADWWDGDRDTENRDRQRAEVKGLGPHQKTGDTFEYATTWRTDSGFHGTKRFCHVFQLKATNGDSGAPLVTLSVLDGAHDACVQYWPGGARGFRLVRRFHWVPGVWQTVRIRVKTSATADGEILVSVGGDPFSGVTGVAVIRPDATDYRPKWGFYRGMASGLRVGDDWVEHKNVSAQKLSGSGGAPASSADSNLALEAAARRMAQTSPAAARTWLLAQPASPARNFALAGLAGTWAESDPAAAAAWAERLAPGDGRAAALQHAYNRWVDADVPAAAHWMATHAPDPALDSLLWYLVTDTTLRYVDRPVALANAALISDSDLRAKAVAHVTLIWGRRDPAAAARYVAATPALTSAQKDSILAKLNGEPRAVSARR